MKKCAMAVLLIMAASIYGFGNSHNAKAKHHMQIKPFGKTADGREVQLFVLKNANGVEAAITSYGATLVSLTAPDRQGKFADVILGYDNAEGYEKGTFFFGATIGRYGNRIAKGKFTLNGTAYTLPTNDGPNSLHGGPLGFNKQLWQGKDVSTASASAVRFEYLSKDGEMGYPGNLKVQVTYTLTSKNELRIDYHATSDKDTIVNLTNHSYFNLTGKPDSTILGHKLTLHASKFTPVDSTLIPTGELRSVKGTPLDFTTAHEIGERINQDDEQLKLGRGYDHNFVLDGSNGTLKPAAELYEPTSGRLVEVLTTEPGIQFYSGNFLDGTAKGKAGASYPLRSGMCLETQHYPDSPNQASFPSTELKAGQEYKTTTVYRFTVKK